MARRWLGRRWTIARGSKTLQVFGSLQRVQGKLERSLPKTKAGARTLLLPEVLVELLAEHQQQQAAERVFWGEEWQEHDLLFPAERGTPMEPRNLHRHFKLALKRAGLPAITRFHDLRHSGATFLIAQGVHPRIVMEILGHSQISLTMNTHGHGQPETQREATTKVAGMFGKRPQAPAKPPTPDSAAEDVQPGAVADGKAPDAAAAQDATGATEPTDGGLRDSEDEVEAPTQEC